MNRACYVGSATKSLRQRLRNTLAMLNSGQHHSYLLQADWRRYSAENFVCWAPYVSSAAEALAQEKRLAVAANAFEDFGGYCQRTGRNCVAASFRETERKLAKARIRRYEFMPGMDPSTRISSTLLDSFQQGNKAKERRLLLNKEEQRNQLMNWRRQALSAHSAGR